MTVFDNVLFVNFSQLSRRVGLNIISIIGVLFTLAIESR